MATKEVLIALILVTSLSAAFCFYIGDFHYTTPSDLNKITVYDFAPEDNKDYVKLSRFRGYPMLIINFPYEVDVKRLSVLNELMIRYSNNNLKILVFPTDEFSKDHHPEYLYWQFEFDINMSKYLRNAHVFFKVNVNGDNSDPLWYYLRTYFSIFNNTIKEDYTIFTVNKIGFPHERLDGYWRSLEELVPHVEQII